jgi:hypothetical protein
MLSRGRWLQTVVSSGVILGQNKLKKGEFCEMEIIPIVDYDTLEIKGVAERQWAEKQNLCHLTTLLVPIRASDGMTVIHQRPPYKTCPLHWDFFGGHVSLNQDSWTCLIGHTLNVSSLVWETAIREVVEELRMLDQDGYPVIIDGSYLKMIDQIGAFPWRADGNVERSTLFLVRVPKGCQIRPMDDAQGQFYRLKYEFLSLATAFQQYKDEKDQRGKNRPFADGAERIFKRLFEETELLTQINDEIKRMCCEEV